MKASLHYNRIIITGENSFKAGYVWVAILTV